MDIKMSETTTKKNRSTGFYEAKGMMRTTVILDKTHQDQLEALTRQFA